MAYSVLYRHDSKEDRGAFLEARVPGVWARPWSGMTLVVTCREGPKQVIALPRLSRDGFPYRGFPLATVLVDDFSNDEISRWRVRASGTSPSPHPIYPGPAHVGVLVFDAQTGNALIRGLSG